MTQDSDQDYTQTLQGLMQQAGLSSFESLYATGISRKQIRRLRRGQLHQLRVETLVKLSQVLQVPIPQLLQIFTGLEPSVAPPTPQAPDSLRQEYHRLQEQLAQQRQELWQEFQQTTLQALESFLLFWPTAAHQAQTNPEFSAVKLLPLLRPLEELLATWNVQTIGEVGEELPYHPQWHQLQAAGATAIPGETQVKITHVGYRQGDRLLYRAKVKLIKEA